MRILKRFVMVMAMSALFLGACSLAPKYQRPEPPVPSQISSEDHSQTPAQNITELDYRHFFPEPRLVKLISLALNQNRELKLASLKVLEARATYGVTRSERFPMLEAEGQKTVTGGPRMDTRQSYEAMISMPGFELDFFGKIKNMAEAALEEYLATEEAEKNVRIALISEVAEAYLMSQLAKERLELAQKNLQSFKVSRNFVEERLRSGQSSMLDLEEARSMEDFAEVNLAQMKTEITRSDNALNFLLGSFEENPLPPPLKLLNWPAMDLPSEVPSSLLLQRPDVLEAEHMLLAANADIGVARAAFFPSLSLTNSLGFMSEDLGRLFAPETQTWSFIPKLGLPLFTGGRNSKNLELAEVRKEKAIVMYEQAILTAFREVADSLLTRQSLSQERSARKKFLNNQRRVLELATNRYQNGVESYLEVLAAQRGVFEAEMELLDIRRQELMNDINLYRALGGGLYDQNPDALAPAI